MSTTATTRITVKPEDRADLFSVFFTNLVAFRGIKQDTRAEAIHAQRIAFLCSNELIKYYGHAYGQDAEHDFYYWALKNKLTCSEIFEMERVRGKNGQKKVKDPYAKTHRKIFPNLGFKKYTDIAERILFHKRYPLTAREPVSRLPVAMELIKTHGL